MYKYKPTLFSTFTVSLNDIGVGNTFVEKDILSFPQIVKNGFQYCSLDCIMVHMRRLEKLGYVEKSNKEKSEWKVLKKIPFERPSDLEKEYLKLK